MSQADFGVQKRRGVKRTELLSQKFSQLYAVNASKTFKSHHGLCMAGAHVFDPQEAPATPAPVAERCDNDQFYDVINESGAEYDREDDEYFIPEPVILPQNGPQNGFVPPSLDLTESEKNFLAAWQDLTARNSLSRACQKDVFELCADVCSGLRRPTKTFNLLKTSRDKACRDLIMCDRYYFCATKSCLKSETPFIFERPWPARTESLNCPDCLYDTYKSNDGFFSSVNLAYTFNALFNKTELFQRMFDYLFSGVGGTDNALSGFAAGKHYRSIVGLRNRNAETLKIGLILSSDGFSVGTKGKGIWRLSAIIAELEAFLSEMTSITLAFFEYSPSKPKPPSNVVLRPFVRQLIDIRENDLVRAFHAATQRWYFIHFYLITYRMDTVERPWVQGVPGHTSYRACFRCKECNATCGDLLTQESFEAGEDASIAFRSILFDLKEVKFDATFPLDKLHIMERGGEKPLLFGGFEFMGCCVRMPKKKAPQNVARMVSDMVGNELAGHETGSVIDNDDFGDAEVDDNDDNNDADDYAGNNAVIDADDVESDDTDVDEDDDAEDADNEGAEIDEEDVALANARAVVHSNLSRNVAFRKRSAKSTGRSYIRAQKAGDPSEDELALEEQYELLMLRSPVPSCFGVSSRLIPSELAFWDAKSMGAGFQTHFSLFVAHHRDRLDQSYLQAVESLYLALAMMLNVDPAKREISIRKCLQAFVNAMFLLEEKKTSKARKLKLRYVIHMMLHVAADIAFHNTLSRNSTNGPEHGHGVYKQHLRSGNHKCAQIESSLLVGAHIDPTNGLLRRRIDKGRKVCRSGAVSVRIDKKMARKFKALVDSAFPANIAHTITFHKYLFHSLAGRVAGVYAVDGKSQKFFSVYVLLRNTNLPLQVLTVFVCDDDIYVLARRILNVNRGQSCFGSAVKYGTKAADVNDLFFAGEVDDQFCICKANEIVAPLFGERVSVGKRVCLVKYALDGAIV